MWSKLCAPSVIRSPSFLLCLFPPVFEIKWLCFLSLCTRCMFVGLKRIPTSPSSVPTISRLLCGCIWDRQRQVVQNADAGRHWSLQTSRRACQLCCSVPSSSCAANANGENGSHSSNPSEIMNVITLPFASLAFAPVGCTSQSVRCIVLNRLQRFRAWRITESVRTIEL